MSERVLITGASGFISYHIIEAALNAGYEVFAAVRKSSKIDHLSAFNINYSYPNFESIGDLENDIITNRYDYIIHAAGVTSALSAADYNKYNTDYTLNLAKASVGKVNKFIFLSSLAAIGPLEDINAIITEVTIPNPVTHYGKSKLAAERGLTEIAGLNYTIIRPTAVYGPRERGIFIFFKQVSRHIELYISNKKQKLSFIYCKDLAKVIISSLQKGSGSYNISDGKFYDRNALANISKDILNLRTLKLHLPVSLVKLLARAAERIALITKKPAPLNIDKLKELTAINWECDINKATKELDFEPVYDLQSGLKETIAWYKKENWL